MSWYDLYKGDCLKQMKTIPDGSVDMILCDLPYGILNKANPNARWDSEIDLAALWPEYNRVCKENGAVLLFATGMFLSDVMYSNKTMWKYNLIWKKGNRPTGFLNAKKQPLRVHEEICVFYKKQPIYNPQFSVGNENHSKGVAGDGKRNPARNSCYGEFKSTPTIKTNLKYPLSVIDIPKEHPQKYHPAQKPVALLEYLVKTYTNPGDVVLDSCMGSGSTGVACMNTERRFIGIEMYEQYFEVSRRRIYEAWLRSIKEEKE